MNCHLVKLYAMKIKCKTFEIPLSNFQNVFTVICPFLWKWPKWSDYEFFEDGRFFIRGQSLQKIQLFGFWDFLLLSIIAILEPYESFKKSYHGASYL